MNEKTLRALIDAGAIKNVHIIANGALFHVDIDTLNDSVTALTLKGKIKTWSTVDTAAKWVHSLGFGRAQLDLEKWQPRQKALGL